MSNHSDKAETAIARIINVANELQANGSTGASTGEQIAAAFVLNEQKYLPGEQDMVRAWDRLALGDYQHYVKVIKYDYMHLIKEG